MALARRNRNNMDIWPGFVDALATLLMVIIFLLLIFVISQVFLNEEAGGFATDAQGRAFSFKRTDVVTANEKIHKSLLDVLRSAK